LINNAGGGQSSKGSIIESHMKPQDLTKLLNLNVVAVHIVTSAILRHCTTDTTPRSRPNIRSIINVSSRAAKIGIPGNAFYVASKFALEGYSATLAEELRSKNCVVNTISPGMVDTKSFPKPAGKPGVRTPESIRDALILLLKQNTITGHYVHVDELDQVRAKGLPDVEALKPMNEPTFSP
jgi:short-subunit dehydrogenase